MTAPRDRVLALIARVVDAATTEEEQRTSAVIACRLISTHKLLDAVVPVARTGARAHSWWVDEVMRQWDADQRRAQERRRDPRYGVSSEPFDPTVDYTTRSAPREHVVNSVNVGAEARPPIQRHRRRVIVAVYGGECKVCGAAFKPGDSIAWHKQAGAACVGCDPS